MYLSSPLKSSLKLFGVLIILKPAENAQLDKSNPNITGLPFSIKYLNILLLYIKCYIKCYIKYLNFYFLFTINNTLKDEVMGNVCAIKEIKKGIMYLFYSCINIKTNTFFN